MDDYIEDDTRIEDLVVGFTDAYNEAVDSGDKILSTILREELRKVLTNSGPMFRIDPNFDSDKISFEV